MIKILSKDDFANSFGVNSNELAPTVIKMIEEENLQIVPIVGKERDELIIEVIDRIRSDRQVIAAKERTEVWEKGWAENLAAFKKNPQLNDALVPKFIRPNRPIRWQGKYYNSRNLNFELSFIKILREHIFTRYFNSVKTIYEFGAGTGFNLLHASESLPNVELIGTDFVNSAVELINEVGMYKNINLKGYFFDMLTPSSGNLSIKSDSAIWTFGSLEQLRSQIIPFVDFLVSQKPKISVHIEPDSDFYQGSSLEDYLAKWFQTQRGYTSGLVEILQSYQEKGFIEIIDSRRLFFGSTMMEGYNLIVWKTA